MTENLVKSTLFCKKDKVFLARRGLHAPCQSWDCQIPRRLPLGVIFEAYLFSPYLGR